MKFRRYFLTLLFYLSLSAVDGQLTTGYKDFLETTIRNSKKTKDKVYWLSTAARYYMEPDENKSNSLIDEARQLAKNDTRLSIMVLLFDAERLLMLNDNKHYISKSLEESKNALAIAQSNRLKDMEAGAYLYLAEGYRHSGDLVKADSLIRIGLDLVNGENSFTYDSLTVECLVTQSRIQQAQRKLAQSLKSASDAYKQAKDMGNKYLEYLTEERMGSVYSSYGSQANRADYRKAREYFLRSIVPAKPRYHEYELIDGYVQIAGCYENENSQAFIDSALENYRIALWLAEKTDKDVKPSYIQLRLIECFMNGWQGDSAELYMKKFLPRLHAYFEKVKLKERLYYRLGNIFKDLGLYYYDSKNDRYKAKAYFDSSYKYFYNAYDYYNSKATGSVRTFFYIDYGVTNWYLSLIHRILNRSQQSTYDDYASGYEKPVKRYDDSSHLNWSIKLIKDYAFWDAWQSDHRPGIRNAASWLEKIYKNQSADIAYRCRVIYDSISLLLRTDAAEEAKVITTYEQTKADNERDEKERRRRNNYQYTGITVLLVVVFIALAMMGFIRVSTTVIRILGFFSFILLFEFIVLIADNYIHAVTHGEPWKVLTIKIGLAAILVPLHHLLEKKAIKYLMRRQITGAVLSKPEKK
jgi:NADH:ubiquinone oxidoreductase subunit 3 (subunit A)